MTGFPRTFRPAPIASLGDRLLDAAYRWCLPAAGIVSALVGLGLLVLGGVSLGSETSLALFLTGWGAAAVLFSLSWRMTSPRVTTGPMAAPRPTSAPMAVAPTRSGGPSLAFGNHISPAFARRGSEWRVLAAPANPGDETWLSWLPRETRRLGAGSTTGSRRAAYSASRPGSLVAIPNRTQGAGARATTLSGDIARSAVQIGPVRKPVGTREPPRSPATLENLFHTPPPPTRRASEFTEDELDRLFPPAPGGHTPFLTGVPEKVGLREPGPGRPPRATADPTWVPDLPSPPPESVRSSSETTLDLELDRELNDRPAGTSVPVQTSLPEHGPLSAPRGPAEFPGHDVSADDLFLEASNPIPPHLRGIDRRSRADPPRPSRSALASESPKSVCASCSKVVVNLRMSSPCPQCLRPICSECLREAFRSHGLGCCVDCSTPTAIAAS
jgi:hypothetical protein